MKHRTWVICVVCGRKFQADVDGKPKKHYVEPKYVSFGEIQYLTNPGWKGKQREICPGSFEVGDFI